MKICLGKVQGQDEIAIGDNDLGVGKVSPQIVGKQIDLREQTLLLETVDHIHQRLAGSLGVSRDAQFRDESGPGG